MRDAAETPETLVRSHLPLVSHAVAGIASRVPSSLERTALVAAGVAGLRQAARTFDGGSGMTFATFARPSIQSALVHQLRGAAPPADLGIDASALAQLVADVDGTTGVNYGAIVLGPDLGPRDQRQVGTRKAAHYAAVGAASDYRSRLDRGSADAAVAVALTGSGG